MAFFKLAKRCNFCAHKLDKDDNCVNPKCIAHTKPEENKQDNTSSDKK